jgi:hypothetical protein
MLKVAILVLRRLDFRAVGQVIYRKGAVMTDNTFWESFKVEGENVAEKIKSLIHEGNVRRVIVQHQGRTIAEFPLTAGVVGTVLAPVLAAVAALVALLKDCTIHIERLVDESQKQPEIKTAAR